MFELKEVFKVVCVVEKYCAYAIYNQSEHWQEYIYAISLIATAVHKNHALYGTANWGGPMTS